MQRREEHHNTPEQVHHYLQQAVVILEESDVPEDLRQIAFGKVFDAVAGKQIILEQIGALPDLTTLRGH